MGAARCGRSGLAPGRARCARLLLVAVDIADDRKERRARDVPTADAHDRQQIANHPRRMACVSIWRLKVGKPLDVEEGRVIMAIDSTADIRDELGRRRRRRALPADEQRTREAVVPTRHLALAATTPPLRDEWANGLTNLLQDELRIAARGGVISAGECEQLLARLVLIIDQALSAD